MLYKPFVALFMAIAATSGVAASTTPVRRGGGYTTPIPAGNCNTEVKCCNDVASPTDTGNPLTAVVSTLANVDPNLLVGADCVNPVVGVLGNNPTCNGQPLCCQNTAQNGLVNFNCVQVEV